MATKRDAAATGSAPVMRTFVRAPLARDPELRQREDGAAVCRMEVLGEAPGPASPPPRISLYVGGSEALRCARGLHRGDVIETAGNVGPERDRARRQEVVVTERVILRSRAEATA